MFSKRLITLLTALSLSFAFVACDDKDDDDKGKTENNGQNGNENGGQNGNENGGQNGNENGGQNVDIAAEITAAKADLTACDFSKASKSYDTIYSAAAATTDKMTADIAVTRSVLGLINLLNNDKLKTILPKFGFEANQMDFSYFWKSSTKGVFAIMQSADKDYDKLLDNFEHPAYSGDKDFFEVLDKSFTLGDVVAVLVSMEDDFDSLAASFEAAAKLVPAGQVVTVADAGCGLNKLKFSNADLYAFAAMLRLTSSVVDLAGSLDLNMTMEDFIKYMIDEYDEYDQCNESETEADCKQACTKYKSLSQSFIKMITTVKGKSLKGRAALVDAARLVNVAVSSASTASSDSFFGWSNFKAGSIKDVNDIAAGVSDTKVVLSAALFTTEMSFDLTKVFDNPTALKASKLETVCELGSWESSYYYIDENYVRGTDAALADYVNAISNASVFTFDEDGDPDLANKYSMDYSTAWEDFDILNFLDPHEYFVSDDDDSDHGCYDCN